MKISRNTIERLIGQDLPSTSELVERINQRLGGVEDVVKLSPKYRGATIVKIVHTEKHPNADRLNICFVDDGGMVKNIDRNQDGLVQVVCGAPNVHADMYAIWLPPNTVVPSTYGTDEQFTLSTRDLRGVKSNGMLAAADELAIGSDHEGIVELKVNDLPSHVEARNLAPGQDFAELFDLDDTIIDIENKMFTHRPDCFGQLGVAREIAGIYGKKFDDPRWYYELNPLPIPSHNFELETYNDAGIQVPRFMAIGFDGVKIQPSPFWLQAKLVALGSKPINNIVDITNYVMLMTAQPLHAYDYDKLRGARLGARMAKEDETIELLNGKTYTLNPSDIVIADAHSPVGLGGIMGGSETEVSNSTTRIVLECASFDMYSVRKSSMRHGIFTDALARFNKGQSMLMSPYVMQYAETMLTTLAGARRATDTKDDLLQGDETWRATPPVTPMLAAETIEVEFINTRLGLSLSPEEIMRLLSNVGIEVKKLSDIAISYWAPAWRMDIQDKEDVVEEIGRLYGFDKLPLELPRRSVTPAPHNHVRRVADMVRHSLSSMGANEVLTYSFVHENVLKRAGQDASMAYSLSNALSPSLQYYRVSLVPSLLDKIHQNIKSGYDDFCLFEIGKAHVKNDFDDEGLPTEYRRIAGVYTNKANSNYAPYFTAQKFVTQLCVDFGIANRLTFVKFTDFNATDSDAFDQLSRPFELERTSVVLVNGRPGGVVGELKASVHKSYKLPSYTAAFELFPSLFERSERTDSYKPLSRYPQISQDISLRGDATISYGSIIAAVNEALHSFDTDQCVVEVTPVSIYVGDDEKVKTTTLHIVMTHYERTLTDEDVEPIMEAIATRAAEQFGLERV